MSSPHALGLHRPADTISGVRAAAGYFRLISRHPVSMTVIACALFHARYKWRGYPRSIITDISRMRRLTQNALMCRGSDVTTSLLMQISDPASVMCGGGCAHDGLWIDCLPSDQLIWAEDRGLAAPGRFYAACFGSYLKKTGDLVSAEKFYRRLSESPTTKYEAYLGMADIRHVIARWSREITSFEKFGAYPSEKITGTKYSAGWGQTIISFTFSDAIEYYKKALQVSSHGLCARFHLGRVLLDSGEVSGACHHFRAVHEARPDFIHVSLAYSYAMALAGEGRSSEALHAALSSHDAIYGQTGQTKVAEILPIVAVADRLGVSTLQLLTACKLSGNYRVGYKGQLSTRSLHLSFPAVFAATFSSARYLGGGLLLVADRYLVEDGKTNRGALLKLFAPPVLAFARERAVVGFPPNDRAFQAQCAIVLPSEPPNYYHWMTESLPELLLLGEIADLRYLTLVCKTLAPFQVDSMRAALPSMPAIHIEEEGVERLLFREVLYAQNPSPHTVPNPEAATKVRNRLSRHLGRATKGKRVYLTRLHLPGRQTLNEKRVVKLLRGQGFDIRDPGTMTLEEQIEFFKDVEIVVASAGAALTNLLFCPADTRVIIITSPFHHFETFTAIAAAIGQPCWVCLSDGTTAPRAYFVWSTFDMEVDLNDIANCLEEAVSSLRA